MPFRVLYRPDRQPSPPFEKVTPDPKSEMPLGGRRGQNAKAVLALRPDARQQVGGKYPGEVASEMPLQDHHRPIEKCGAQM